MPKIICKHLEWCNPMPNAWSTSVFGATIQILGMRDGYFHVIVPGSLGGTVSTDAEILEDEAFDSLSDAKNGVRKFMNEMINTIAMIEPEGEPVDD